MPIPARQAQGEAARHASEKRTSIHDPTTSPWCSYRGELYRTQFASYSKMRRWTDQASSRTARLHTAQQLCPHLRARSRGRGDGTNRARLTLPPRDSRKGRRIVIGKAGWSKQKAACSSATPAEMSSFGLKFPAKYSRTARSSSAHSEPTNRSVLSDDGCMALIFSIRLVVDHEIAGSVRCRVTESYRTYGDNSGRCNGSCPGQHQQEPEAT